MNIDRFSKSEDIKRKKNKRQGREKVEVQNRRKYKQQKMCVKSKRYKVIKEL